MSFACLRFLDIRPNPYYNCHNNGNGNIASSAISAPESSPTVALIFYNSFAHLEATCLPKGEDMPGRWLTHTVDEHGDRVDNCRRYFDNGGGWNDIRQASGSTGNPHVPNPSPEPVEPVMLRIWSDPPEVVRPCRGDSVRRQMRRDRARSRSASAW